jgi:hypothetical protein
MERRFFSNSQNRCAVGQKRGVRPAARRAKFRRGTSKLPPEQSQKLATEWMPLDESHPSASAQCNWGTRINCRLIGQLGVSTWMRKSAFGKRLHEIGTKLRVILFLASARSCRCSRSREQIGKSAILDKNPFRVKDRPHPKATASPSARYVQVLPLH